jgi:hypothetical protein
VDPDQMGGTTMGKLGGTFTDLLAFGGVIKKDRNAFPAGQIRTARSGAPVFDLGCHRSDAAQ